MDSGILVFICIVAVVFGIFQIALMFKLIALMFKLWNLCESVKQIENNIAKDITHKYPKEVKHVEYTEDGYVKDEYDI